MRHGLMPVPETSQTLLETLMLAVGLLVPGFPRGSSP